MAGICRFLVVVLMCLAAPSAWAEARCLDNSQPTEVITKESLWLVTLNMAHGRKDGRNQMLLRGETIRNNLLDVAELMDRSIVDIIALQEADAESAWSGRFHHIDFLAEHTHYKCFFHGIHSSTRLYDYGTALMSPYAFSGGFAHSFQPSWPTTTKGFVVSSLNWNPGGKLAEPLHLKLVSLHLDFSRRSVRRAQVEEMIGVLKSLERPMVLMGDFNTDWNKKESSLKHIAETLDLHVFQPHAEGLGTYGDRGARLDWILISSDLGFKSYAVKPDVVSDHYAVGAEIYWRGGE